MTIVKGWQAASAASGIAVRSLRRLAQAGVLPTIKNADGSHAFDLNDLLKLKAGRHGSGPGAPTLAAPMPVTPVSPTLVAVPPASATPVTAPTAPAIAPWLLQAAASRGAAPANDDDDIEDDESEDDGPTMSPFSTWNGSPLGASSWPNGRDDEFVPVVDPITFRIAYIRAHRHVPPTALQPVAPDAAAYWSRRNSRVSAIAAMNAQQAAMSSLQPEVVNAVWFAAGQAAWALDDQTLWSDYGYSHARRAGEQVVQALAWHMAAMAEQEVRGRHDAHRLDERRYRRRSRR